MTDGRPVSFGLHPERDPTEARQIQRHRVVPVGALLQAGHVEPKGDGWLAIRCPLRRRGDWARSVEGGPGGRGRVIRGGEGIAAEPLPRLRRDRQQEGGGCQSQECDATHVVTSVLRTADDLAVGVRHHPSERLWEGASCPTTGSTRTSAGGPLVCREQNRGLSFVMGLGLTCAPGVRDLPEARPARSLAGGQASGEKSAWARKAWKQGAHGHRCRFQMAMGHP